MDSRKYRFAVQTEQPGLKLPIYWRKHNIYKKFLFLFLLAFFVAVLNFALSRYHRMRFVYRHDKDKALPIVTSVEPIHEKDQLFKRLENSSVCTSAKCVDYAKSIQKSLSPKYATINPCEDFSTYACEGWRQTHNYTLGDTYVDTFSIMGDMNNRILHSILDGNFENRTSFPNTNRDIARENFDKLKTAYNACMGEEAIKKAGVAPLRALLDEMELLYPAAPLLTSGIASKPINQELTEILIWMAKRTVPTLIGTSIMPDIQNPQASIFITGSGSTEASGYYENNNIMRLYTQTNAQMFQLILSGESIQNGSSSQYLNMATKVLALEQKLTEVSMQMSRDKLSTLAEFDAVLPEISITKFINAQKPAMYEIKTINGNIDHLRGLSSILKSTPRELLHSYFQLNIIKTWVTHLSEDYSRPLEAFREATGDTFRMAPVPRREICVGEVRDSLDSLLSSVFIERAFSPEAKAFGDRIVESIMEVYSTRLDSLEWMSNSTKTTAKKKLASIVSKVGYLSESPNIIDPVDVKNHYNNVTVTNSYFKNAVTFAECQAKNAWNTLLDGDTWGLSRMSVPAATAFYSLVINAIVIPAGIMQIPLFSYDLPEYVSYGGLGSVIGHELSHGIDAGSTKTDERGMASRWWDSSTTKNYEERAKCFVRQYSNFTFTDQKGNITYVNGNLTQEENIADAGGLSASFAAWKKRDKARPNELLPGLEEFTKEQIFFLSYASIWCAKVEPEEVAMNNLIDVHSPRDKRILGTLANSKDFREAFKCKTKQPTCELW